MKSADYVYKVEGGVEQVDFQLQSQGKGLSNYNYEKNLMSLDDADIKSPSKLYSTVTHEMRHKPLWENTGSVLDWQLEKSFDTEKYATALGTQEKIINRELMSHKYFRFWDLSRQIEIKTNYIRYKDFHDARFDLQY